MIFMDIKDKHTNNTTLSVRLRMQLCANKTAVIIG